MPSHYPTTDHGARRAQPRTQSAAAVSRHVQRSRDGYTLQPHRAGGVLDRGRDLGRDGGVVDPDRDLLRFS